MFYWQVVTSFLGSLPTSHLCISFQLVSYNSVVFTAIQEEPTDVKMEGVDQPVATAGDEEGMPIDGEFQVLDSVGDTDGIEGDGKCHWRWLLLVGLLFLLIDLKNMLRCLEHIIGSYLIVRFGWEILLYTDKNCIVVGE